MTARTRRSLIRLRNMGITALDVLLLVALLVSAVVAWGFLLWALSR